MGPPSSRGRFGHGKDSSDGPAAAMANSSGVRRGRSGYRVSACSAPQASSASPDRARSSGSRSLRATPPRWRRRRLVAATRSGRPGTGNRQQDSGDGQPGPWIRGGPNADPSRSTPVSRRPRFARVRHGQRTRHRITDASLSGGRAPRPADSRRRSCYHPRSEPVLGPVGMCGFDRAWLPGNASRGRHWASLIRWQKEVPGNRQSTLALAA